jgi:hypothetical protein
VKLEIARDNSNSFPDNTTSLITSYNNRTSLPTNCHHKKSPSRDDVEKIYFIFCDNTVDLTFAKISASCLVVHAASSH